MSAIIERMQAADRDHTSVLVIDDVLPIVEEMLTLLELRKIPAVAACSLDDAVLALEDHPNVSVVVCDLRLGKESGLDLIARAKAHPRISARRLAYIFVTGDPMGIDELPPGLDPVILTKPVMPREFIGVIDRLLGKND